MDTNNIGEEGGSNTGKKDYASPLELLKAQFEKAYTKLRRTFDQRILDEVRLGEIFGKIIVRIKVEGLTTVQMWVKQNDLSCSYQYAMGCVRLFRSFETYKEAHDWRQSDAAKGWPKPKRVGGWEYAMEIIKQHAAATAGKLPPNPEHSAPQQPDKPKPTKGPDKEAADTTPSVSKPTVDVAPEADRIPVAVAIRDTENKTGVRPDVSDYRSFRLPEGRDALMARHDALLDDIQELEAQLTAKKAELADVKERLAGLDSTPEGEPIH